MVNKDEICTDYQAVVNLVAQYRTNLTSYNSKINGHISSLLTIEQTIKDNQDTVTNADTDLSDMRQNQPRELVAAEQTVKEKEEAFAKLKAGADPLDIRSQELALEQRRNALADARQGLADAAVRAPVAGKVALISAKLGDTISTSSAAVTIVAKQQIAEVSLNEVDVAKIKIGLKATLTFDAIEGLNISGQVIDIDIIGTISQGVVSYN